MKKLLALILGLALALPALAEVPASVRKAVDKVNSAPSLTVKCLINGAPATLTLSGRCFMLDMGEMAVYFNGRTQWAYNAADSEVTVFEPTEEELAESNPLLILGSLAGDFDGKELAGRPGCVRLTPLKPGSDIAEVTVCFSSSTGWPESLTVVTSGGRADISSMVFSAGKTKMPPSAFQFRVPEGTLVTDLR